MSLRARFLAYLLAVHALMAGVAWFLVAQNRFYLIAVEAVLAVAGHRRQRQETPPGALTRRQVEVLRLVAAGRTNREIAEALVISPRTAEHHVQDVYARIGVSTRAGAALYAMEHRLLGWGARIGGLPA